MDSTRFDTLTSTFAQRYSRRGACTALAAGALGLLGLAETTAKTGKKGKGKRPKKGKAPTRHPSPPRATCNDGIKNGDESDVDCGGRCPRCATGKSCTSRNDCVSASCPLGTCEGCAADADCGEDAFGQCYCDPPGLGGPRVCSSNRVPPGGAGVTSCAQCPAGTTCLANSGIPGIFNCNTLCGAP
jgi:hypothetical protein